MNDRIHLACATDARYAPWCATMLLSAVTRSRQPVTVHLLHPEDLAPATLDQLRRVVVEAGGSWRPTAVSPAAIGDLPGTGYFPPIIWYRSLLPELRPDLDRVLYLDADTLVVDDLAPLWSTDVTDLYGAAALNLMEPGLADRPQAVGIPADRPYFNSGVLLMNLEALRQDDCVRALHEHARQHRGRSRWPDQDSLNFVIGRRCTLVHPRWNCQNSFFYWPHAADVLGADAHAEALRRPAILHFEGPPMAKPWHYLNRHPWRDEYRAQLARTPFASTPVQGRTLRNVVARFVMADPQLGLRRWRGNLRRPGGARA